MNSIKVTLQKPLQRSVQVQFAASGALPGDSQIADVWVDGVLISEQQIQAEAQNHPSTNAAEALQAAGEALVVRQLLVAEAQRLGIQTIATDIDHNALPLDVIIEGAPAGRQTNEDALVDALLSIHAYAPTAFDDECRRYYHNNLKRFMSEPIFEARHILIGHNSPDGEPEAVAKRLISMLQEKPHLFAQLAEQFSACSSKIHGGNLGQISGGNTVPEFESALRQMSKVGLCEVPVQTKYGYHIICLDRRIPGEQLPYDSVKGKISIWLDAIAWSKSVSQYVSILAEKAQIVGLEFDRDSRH